MACDASFLKHYHTPVIHFGTLHFKKEETLYYSAGPISRYSPYLGSETWSKQDCLKSREGEVIRGTVFLYFYISMNLFSVINSLMTEKGELITWGL